MKSVTAWITNHIAELLHWTPLADQTRCDCLYCRLNIERPQLADDIHER